MLSIPIDIIVYMIPAIVIISVVVIVIGISVFISQKKKLAIKRFESAIFNSPRIKLIKSIDEKYQFKTFNQSFVYVVHFKDLDEYKVTDLKLVKYNCLLRKRDEIVSILESLNYNIENYKKYYEEIENARNYDDTAFLREAKVNIDEYRKKEGPLISALIKTPLLSCSFDIYYDYVWASGKTKRESEHFKVFFDTVVVIEDFLNGSFPSVRREDYNFKNHRRYAQENETYICDSLFLTNDEVKAKNELKKEKERIGLQYGDDYEFFISAKTELFAYLDKLGLKYQIVDPYDDEFIVIIEESTYLFVGHYCFEVMPTTTVENHFTNYCPVVVELNYNPFFSFDPPSEPKVHFAYFKYLTFSTRTPHEYAFKKAKSLIPNIDIDEINEEWEGLPSFCIVYELIYRDSYSYALMITENIDKAFLVGNGNYKTLLSMSDSFVNKDFNKNALFDDIKTFGLSCTDDFMQNLIYLKKDIDESIKPSEVFEYKVYENISFYLLPINIKSKDRNYVEKLKREVFDKLNHSYLKQFDLYHYVDGHQKWKNEYLLYTLCKQLYGDQVIYQYRPSFLHTGKSQLSYDIYLSQFRIAIEYQGQQHFEPIDYFGGEESFEDTKRRDTLKKKLSIKNNIPLIEITYKETITSKLIIQKVDEARRKNDI